MSTAAEISVVVPLFDEVENVAPLVRSIDEALTGIFRWELIVVNDGSTDGTGPALEAIAEGDPRVRVLHLARNFGQTAAMQAGFDHARGNVVVSMDGDLQNDPRDIPRLVEELGDGYDLVAGHRRDRQDGFFARKIPSRIANAIIRLLTGVGVSDVGCSLRAYRSQLVAELELYSDMHRYLPVVAATVAGARIKEVPVRHHPRTRGRSKYGIGRTWRVVLDLFVLVLIRSFSSRPLAFFAWASLATSFVGVAFLAATGYAVVWIEGYEATAYVFPGAALICLGLSGYLIMLGLLAEVAVPRRAAGFTSATGRIRVR